MSHPRFRRFFFAFAAAAMVFILAAWGLIFRGLYLVPVNKSAELVYYQKEKIRNAPPSDVILVGDSSLGMSIDAEELSRLSGERCLNLALNGNFGTEGSLEMIKWALDRHPVHQVIVMQTMDMLTRQQRSEALIYVLHRPWSVFSPSVEDSMRNIDALIEVFFSGKLLMENLALLVGVRWNGNLRFQNDYVRQQAEISLQKAEADNLDGKVRRDQVVNLQRIKELCAERGVDFIYLHGPIYDDAAMENPKLLASINDALRKAEIPSDYVVEKMSFADLGDSIDHVEPDKKDEFTRKYFDRLRSWLAKH